ncbi:MAG: hypothetical protein N2745_07935 [Syntrophorhabdaceae bacterium]|nr:hypothetical protein [Syntrophorhabdaceae bacterium]
MKGRIAEISVFFLFLIVMAQPAYPSEKVSFPDKAYGVDPTERYIIEWERDKTKEKGYVLFLRHIKTGERRKLIDFFEKTEVMWSPDGSFFSVAEWNGTFFSDIFIYSIRSPDDVIDLQEVMARSFKKIDYIRENENVVFEAIKWVDKDRIRFRVYGSGKRNPEGFERFFEYKVGGKAREIKG